MRAILDTADRHKSTPLHADFSALSFVAFTQLGRAHREERGPGARGCGRSILPSVRLDA